jgi:hypothetical protein
MMREGSLFRDICHFYISSALVVTFVCPVFIFRLHYASADENHTNPKRSSDTHVHPREKQARIDISIYVSFRIRVLCLSGSQMID